MDLLSCYSSLQYHRETLLLPYFTLQEFIAAMQLKTAADRFLMTVICHQLLHKINNKPQSFYNSCNQAVTFYNNSTSRSKQLAIISRHTQFVELTLSAKLEVIQQLTLSVYNQAFSRYDGEGKFFDTVKSDVESFISLGVDSNCNEYFLLYPDIIVIYSLKDKITLYDGKKNQVTQLNDYLIDDKKIKIEEFDEFIINNQTVQSNSQQQFNQYLKKNEVLQFIYDGEGKVVEQVDSLERSLDYHSVEQKERYKFYNFDFEICQNLPNESTTEKDVKSGMFDLFDIDLNYEYKQFGIDQIVNQVQQLKYQELVEQIEAKWDTSNVQKNIMLQLEANEEQQEIVVETVKKQSNKKQANQQEQSDDLYEDEENNEQEQSDDNYVDQYSEQSEQLPKTEIQVKPAKKISISKKQIDIQGIKNDLLNQYELFQQFKKLDFQEQEFTDSNRIAQYLQQNEISLVLYAASNCVKYQQLFNKQNIFQSKKPFIHCIKINKNLELLQNTVNYIQFSTIQHLQNVLLNKQKLIHNNKIIEEINQKNFHTYRENLLMQADHVYSILHTSYQTLVSYSQHQKQNFQQFKLENILLYPEMSDLKNNFQLRFQEINDNNATVIFRRLKIPDAGNLLLLQNFPIYMRNKQFWPKSDDLRSFKLELGFEAQVVEMPTIQQNNLALSSSSEESEPSSESRRRRRRGYDFSDDEYYSDYDDMITSNESLSPPSSSSPEEEEKDEVIWELKQIARKNFDFDTMETVDAAGKIVLQPRKRTEENVIIDAIFNDPRPEESDIERIINVREWSSKELFQKELLKRQKAKQREINKLKKQQTKKKHRRHRRENVRKNTIVVSQQNAAQFTQFNSMMEQQKQQAEALKQLALQQMQGGTGLRVQVPKMQLFGQKTGVYANNQQIKQQLYQNKQQVTNKQNQVKQEGFHTIFQQSAEQSANMKFAQQFRLPGQQTQQQNQTQQPGIFPPIAAPIRAQRPKSELSVGSLKQRIKYHTQNKNRMSDNILKAGRDITAMIEEQEDRGTRGRFPLTFYDGVRSLLQSLGLTVEQYMADE